MVQDMSISGKMSLMKKERGFSMTEVMTVCAIVSILLVVAAPNMTRALKSYRLSIGAQQIAGAIQTAKLRAVSTNQTQSVFFDNTDIDNPTIAVANAANAVPLPPGIKFVTPTVLGPQVIREAATAASGIPGQQSDPCSAVSFPVGGSATVRQASFNWRGLPAVTPGAVNWVYLTNTRGELMAVTLSSAGSVNTWRWNTTTSTWDSSRHA